jgi:hypothetical protein
MGANLRVMGGQSALWPVGSDSRSSVNLVPAWLNAEI